MEVIILTVIGVAILLVLMFVISKFLMREQTFDKAAKLELKNAPVEPKSGKQKRRHVYSKQSDKQKSGDEKQKPADASEKLSDIQQKPSDSKQKSSPEHRSKSAEDKATKSGENSKVAKGGTNSDSEGIVSSPSKKHVEIKPKVETIDPELEAIAPRTGNPEKSLTSHPSRSILVNKDEKSLIIEAETVPETFHPRHAPVDELDRKKQEEMQLTSGFVIGADKDEQSLGKAEQGTTPSPAGKSNYKKKKKGKTNESASDAENKVAHEKNSESGNLMMRDSKDVISAAVKMLDSCELGEDECFSLIKALESRGFAVTSDFKKKKEEEVDILKKRVKDLETSLQKEKLNISSSSAQVGQLKQDLILERQKTDNFKSTQQMLTAKQIQEINDLKSRLEMVSRVQDQERKQFQMKVESIQLEVVEKSHAIQALVDENGRLKERSQVLNQQLLVRGSEQKNLLRDDAQFHLEDNIKQFENQFEEMVAKQEMERLKDEYETVILSYRNKIEELTAEVLDRDNKIDLLQHSREDTVRPVEEAVCEQKSVTWQQHAGASPLLLSSPAATENGTVLNGYQQDTVDQNTFQDEKIRELETHLQLQKEKNDELRRKNWKIMEALSERENQLQNAGKSKTKAGTENAEQLTPAQLQSVNKEKLKLEKLREEQERKITSLQKQISELQTQLDRKDQSRVMEQNSEYTDNDSDILKLEESLNRQIRKNDDLRRRNWKTMEALTEMEKRMSNNVQTDTELEQKMKSLQKEKADLEILNKGLTTTLATCVLKVEESEQRASDAFSQLKKVNADFSALKMAKTSSDGLNDSQLKRISQLEAFINEKNTHIKQLEDEISAAQKTVSRDLDEPVSLPPPCGSVSQSAAPAATVSTQSRSSEETNRKEIMVVTRVQETAKWDVSQLVLDLDTKTAEVEILQSLLDQNENALRDMQQEKSKTVESVHHMRQSLKEKDVTIELLETQLKNYQATEGSEPQSKVSLSPRDLKEDKEQSSNSIPSNAITNGEEYKKVLAEQKSLQDQVKHYQDVLEQTVGMLCELQSSVEREESKWRQRALEAEERVVEAVEQGNQLRQELEMLKSS